MRFMKFLIKRLLKDLKNLNSSPMKVLCDVRQTISITHSPVFHDIIKHLKIDKYFIKKMIDGRLHRASC